MASAPLYRKSRCRRNIAAALIGLARVAEASGRPERSARLLGAAHALLEAIGARLGVVHRTEQERCEAAVRAHLGAAALAAAWAEGQAMTLEQASNFALEEGNPS